MIKYLLKDAEIKGFLEGILVDGGMLELNQQVRAQMLSDLYTALDGDLYQLILKDLSPEAAGDLNALIEKKAEVPEVQKFLMEQIPDIASKTGELLKDFKGYYVAH